MHVSVHAAKTQLSKLLDLVEDGEDIVIERHQALYSVDEAASRFLAWNRALFVTTEDPVPRSSNGVVNGIAQAFR